ncbi:hypothetical protein [Sinorhizobium meliloti]|uniref:hypothetical protein n=1 Tax=Rhizobium meliloti TaxID=382 RepID=UPI0018DFC4B9|nr:hypothetical protein [Sinorhizobium meliloti]
MGYLHLHCTRDAGAVLVFALIDVETLSEAGCSEDRQHIVDRVVVRFIVGAFVCAAESLDFPVKVVELHPTSFHAAFLSVEPRPEAKKSGKVE